jgi:hypothetical protein
VRQFKLSNDPAIVDKLRDVVGLYVDPPAHAGFFGRSVSGRRFKPSTTAEDPGPLDQAATALAARQAR